MRRFRNSFSTFAVGALMTVGVIAASSATAVAAPIVTTIGPTGCTNSSCQGGIYTLSVDFVSTSSGNSTYNVSLTVDTNTGPYTGGADYITSASLKISNAIVSATQTGAPNSYNYGSGAFTTIGGGVNAGGCDGSGGGFFCSGIPNDGTKGYGALVSNGTNTWNWQVVIASGSLFTDLEGSSVKVRYADWDSNSTILTKVGGLVSEDFGPGSPGLPPVPEPTTYMLTGIGLLGLGLVRRYRKSV